MRKCCRCGGELVNTGGIDWMGSDVVNVLCRTCCGKTEDGQANFFEGRPHVGIAMPLGSVSEGRKATKISTKCR